VGRAGLRLDAGRALRPPQPAPALALLDFQGKTVRLADLKGKVVLVFFWATW